MYGYPSHRHHWRPAFYPSFPPYRHETAPGPASQYSKWWVHFLELSAHHRNWSQYCYENVQVQANQGFLHQRQSITINYHHRPMMDDGKSHRRNPSPRPGPSAIPCCALGSLIEGSVLSVPGSLVKPAAFTSDCRAALSTVLPTVGPLSSLLQDANHNKTQARHNLVK